MQLDCWNGSLHATRYCVFKTLAAIQQKYCLILKRFIASKNAGTVDLSETWKNNEGSVSRTPTRT